MNVDVLWIAERVGKIDALFRHRAHGNLRELLVELADRVPPGASVAENGFRDAARSLEAGRMIDGWDQFNRALADLVAAI